MARQLDIIGEVGGQSLQRKNAQRDCDDNNVPFSFKFTVSGKHQFTEESSRRLHVYANIGWSLTLRRNHIMY